MSFFDKIYDIAHRRSPKIYPKSRTIVINYSPPAGTQAEVDADDVFEVLYDDLARAWPDRDDISASALVDVFANYRPLLLLKWRLSSSNDMVCRETRPQHFVVACPI